MPAADCNFRTPAGLWKLRVLFGELETFPGCARMLHRNSQSTEHCYVLLLMLRKHQSEIGEMVPICDAIEQFHHGSIGYITFLPTRRRQIDIDRPEQGSRSTLAKLIEAFKTPNSGCSNGRAVPLAY